MALANTKISKSHKEAIRQAALKRHAERKAAGLPNPLGKPYKKDPPPVVEIVVPEPVAAPAPVVVVPAGPPTPRQLFVRWLSSNAGRNASDTRVPTDPVRFGADLDDRLWQAWQAGYAEGREG